MIPALKKCVFILYWANKTTSGIKALYQFPGFSLIGLSPGQGPGFGSGPSPGLLFSSLPPRPCLP
jgi:hypothetical protein